LLAHGRWFSPGIAASSTTKTGRHDIAEILQKVALKHQKINKKINQSSNVSFRSGKNFAMKTWISKFSNIMFLLLCSCTNFAI